MSDEQVNPEEMIVPEAEAATELGPVVDAAKDRIYVSMSSYMAGKLLGIANAGPRLIQMLTGVHDAQFGDAAWFPALRAITHLRRLASIDLRLDGGATNIAKSRSRHFTAAFDSACKAWVTIDDDVEASLETLAWMLAAIDGDEPSICMVPCVLREQQVANVEWSPIYSVRPLEHPRLKQVDRSPLLGEARRATRGGFGLVAMNRAALDAVAENVGRSWHDDDGKWKFPAFAERLDEKGKWSGEDIAFWSRVPASVRVEALSVGESVHAGYGVEFETFAG